MTVVTFIPDYIDLIESAIHVAKTMHVYKLQWSPDVPEAVVVAIAFAGL